MEFYNGESAYNGKSSAERQGNGAGGKWKPGMRV